MKKITYLFIIFLFLTLLVSCGSQNDSLSDLPDSSSVIEEPIYDDDDLQDQIDYVDTTITFADEMISSTSSDISIEGNIIFIEHAGTYELIGFSSDAQLIIDASNSDLVTLVLNNINLTCLNGPVINILNADKVIINVKENTENQLEDSPTSSIDHQAVVFSKDDLTFNGTGKLLINANYKNGIETNDDLIIINSTIIINASNTAIRANNSLSVTNTNLTLTADNDGIHVENNEDSSLGNILIESGLFTIQANGDAISSSLDLHIMDGTFDIISGLSSTTSGKGLKATHNIIISSGNLNITSIDDAIHSNSGILIDGGEFNLSTNDDAIHSDDELIINDGIIYIVKCFEGLESYVTKIKGGYIDIISSDDGINGSGGVNQSEASAFNPNPIGTASLFIEGGTIMINTMSDGIDVNGSVEMSGGLVVISGPLDGMQGAIDYDVSFNISGGILVAAGAAGREQKNPSATSTQKSVTIYLDTSSTQMIHIETNSGEMLLSYIPEKAYQTLVFSSPDLTNTDSYKVYIGGNIIDETSNTHGYMINGSYTNGTLFDSFTVTSILNTVGTPTVTDLRPPRP